MDCNNVQDTQAKTVAQRVIEDGTEKIETEGVKLLKSLSKNLNEPGNITQILKALQDKDGGEVSTFEFLKSGTVQDLRHYLTGKSLTYPAC